MTALLSAIARDLGVCAEDLRAETARAVLAAPFVFGGLIAFMALLVALVPSA